MLKAAIPVLHVSSSAAAEKFYCEQLGFTLDFAYRVDESLADPCYMGVVRDGVEIHLSSFSGDGVAGNCVVVLVDDVDAVHEELRTKNVTITAGPVDQSWGNREMYVADPDRNSIRFTQTISDH